MTRPSFKNVFPGSCTFSRPNGSGQALLLNVSRVAEEATSGTSRRKPKGWLPPTGYTFIRRDLVYQTGRTLFAPLGLNSSSGSKYVGQVAQTVEGGSGPFNGDDHFNSCVSEATCRADQGLRNLALLRACANLKRSDINLGVAFAERNRTAKLVGDTTINLAKSVQDLRRGNVRGAMRRLGISSKKSEPRGASVPSKWLELQYGWKPLLSDVYGACDALSKRHKEDWRVTAKGRASSFTTHSVTRNLNWANTNGHGGSTTAVVERRAYGRIDALPQNEALISLSSMGAANPALIGWELVPFSFVVDWFLPIGSWLEGLDAMLGYESAYYSDSFWSECNWVDSASETKVSGSNIQEAYYNGNKRYVYLNRAASNSVPFARPPGLKDPRSLGHMANGLALLTQVFRSKR